MDKYNSLEEKKYDNEKSGRDINESKKMASKNGGKTCINKERRTWRRKKCGQTAFRKYKVTTRRREIITRARRWCVSKEGKHALTRKQMEIKYSTSERRNKITTRGRKNSNKSKQDVKRKE